MKKTLFFEVEDNGDLSHTVRTLDDVAEVIKGWMADMSEQQMLEEEIWFQITPKWMTEEEYNSLEE